MSKRTRINIRFKNVRKALPVRTRRCFDVYTASIMLKQRRMRTGLWQA